MRASWIRACDYTNIYARHHPDRPALRISDQPAGTWRTRSVPGLAVPSLRRGRVHKARASDSCSVRSPNSTTLAVQLWDSGRIDSGDSLHHRYVVLRYSPGSVATGKCVSGTSRVQSRRGVNPPGGRWVCSTRWIAVCSGLHPVGTKFLPPRSRRRCCAAYFTLVSPVARARLYITAHGLYIGEINGRRVGNDCLTPGWNGSHHHRLLVQKSPCDRSTQRWRQHDRRHAGRGLVSWPDRCGWAACVAHTAKPSACWRSSSFTTPTGQSRRSPAMNSGERPPARS